LNVQLIKHMPSVCAHACATGATCGCMLALAAVSCSCSKIVLIVCTSDHGACSWLVMPSGRSLDAADRVEAQQCGWLSLIQSICRVRSALLHGDMAVVLFIIKRTPASPGLWPAKHHDPKLVAPAWCHASNCRQVRLFAPAISSAAFMITAICSIKQVQHFSHGPSAQGLPTASEVLSGLWNAAFARTWTTSDLILLRGDVVQ
jgi:hypothetical protein